MAYVVVRRTWSFGVISFSTNSSELGPLGDSWAQKQDPLAMDFEGLPKYLGNFKVKSGPLKVNGKV